MTQDQTDLAERIAELQLAAFLAGRGAKGREAKGRDAPCPTMDEFRQMAFRAVESAADWELSHALAAAAREGGDVKQAPGEAPQSGAKRNAQTPPSGNGVTRK